MDKLVVIKSCDLHEFLQVQVKFLDTQRRNLLDFITQTAKVPWDSKEQTQLFVRAHIWQNDFTTMELAPYLTSLPAETSYQLVKPNSVSFESLLDIDTNISSLSLDAHLVLDIFQTTVQQDEPELLGGTAIPLFDLETGVLREGKYELTVWPAAPGHPTATPFTGKSQSSPAEISDKVAFLEKQCSLQAQGVVPHIDWLDALSYTKIQHIKDQNRSREFLYLTICFPQYAIKSAANSVINPQVIFWEEPGTEISVFTNIYEDVRRKIARSSTGSFRPSLQEKRQLENIINLPIGIELSATQRDLIWRYKDYLAANTSSSIVRFCQSVRWNDDSQESEIAQGLLATWQKPAIQDLLQLLYLTNNVIRRYAVDQLELGISDADLEMFLLQFVQAVRYEGTSLFDVNESAGDAGAVLHFSKMLEAMPLTKFLIERCCGSGGYVLVTNFYWYVKVEAENKWDENNSRKFSKVLEAFMHHLENIDKDLCMVIKRQVQLIDDITAAMLMCRQQATDRPTRQSMLIQILQQKSFQLIFDEGPIPLPLDPRVMVYGVDHKQTVIFKSALMPAKVVFKLEGYTREHPKTYSILLKVGDDVRQDQLIVQMIKLMNQTLKHDNLDLHLTPYNVLPVSTNTGLIEFISDSIPLSGIFKDYKEGILEFLKDENWNKSGLSEGERMERYVKSCAGYCIITYLLGIGDRHFDNLMMTGDGKIFHIDFGFILGRDPKPFPPPMKLSKEMMDPMGSEDSTYNKQFQQHCFTTFLNLRRQSHVFLAVMQLMTHSGIPDIAEEPEKALIKVQDNFVLSVSEDEALAHIKEVLRASMSAVIAVAIEEMHKWTQYWRR